MSKFNKQKTSKEIVEEKPDAISNLAGGLAYTPDKKTKLVKMVATSLVGENKYYQTGQDHDQELINLIRIVARQDPYFVLNLAVYAREVLKLRSVPLMILVEFANAELTEEVPNSRQYVTRTIQRVDELTEIISYQLNRNIQEKRKSKLPMLIKNGVADAFNKFDEYQFAKYNRKGNVTLKDALFLTHPKPKDKQQQKLFDKIVEDKLEVPKTWETYISEHGSNTESWTYIAPKLPIFALVRNLRNLLQNDVPPELYVNKLRNQKVIEKSRMLPFRFYTAYQMVKDDRELNTSLYKRNVLGALEEAMELSIANIGQLPGNTAIFVDVSGSMTERISNYSAVSYMEIGRLFGAMADQISDNAVIGVFGESFKPINIGKIGSTLEKMNSIGNVGVGHSTNGWKAVRWLNDYQVNVDRILIFSDEQLWDSHAFSFLHRGKAETTIQKEIVDYRRNVNPDVFVHSIDLTGYSTSIVSSDDNRANLISGWSEKVLDYIGLFEKGLGNMVKDVEDYILLH